MLIKTLTHKAITISKTIQEKIYAIPNTVFFLLCFISFSLYWFPAYKALYPGTFGYDAPIQIAQYFGEHTLSTHHPITHTFLMGWFFSLGNLLFENYELGFAAYIALQGLIVTSSLSFLFLTIKKCNLNLFLAGIGFLFVLRTPMIQAITFSSTKDVLFAAALLFFVCSLLESSAENNKFSYIKVILSGILMCLLRNQGIYILVAVSLVSFLFHLLSRYTLSCLFTVIGATLLFNAIVTHGFGIPKGDAREMLSVPIQQTAYIVTKHKNELSPRELELIYEVIPADGYTAYQANSADNVKSLFITEALFNNFGNHLANYIILGYKYPGDYLHAWIKLIEGYFNTDLMEYRGLAMTNTFESLNHFDIKPAHLNDAYHLGLWLATQYSQTPLHFRPELGLYCLLFSSALLLLTKKKSSITYVITSVYLLYFGTLLLGPVALVRYLYPITLSTPLFLCLPFYKEKRREV